MIVRKSPTASLVVAAMILALAGLTDAACAASKTECDCVAPGARVHVPPESAGAVTAVALSGAACDGVTAACVQPAATGCATYSFAAKAPGACFVQVFFADGLFAANLKFEQTTGCCTGLYATPASAADIDAVRAPYDAGSGG